MSKSKPYSAVPVNSVVFEELIRGRDGQDVVVGFDVGKYHILAVPRWAQGQFGRPWRIDNPEHIPLLTQLLLRLGQGRKLHLALEPSGTYGDALRQACHNAGLSMWRVSPKASHDYAELFDGTPSQHDGKDAAVVAELAALAKAAAWPFQPRASWQQELVCQVDWLEAQRQVLVVWTGRLEGLLARHWPEATRLLKLKRATLLKALACYGGPEALAADEQAVERLKRWGGSHARADKLVQLVESARSSVGVRQTEVDRQWLARCATQAVEARRQMCLSRRELAELARGQQVLRAQAQAVGPATAAVLYACLGDVQQYECGAAYRKAMGLNLSERSSGTHRGELHVSKRGSAVARRWLYLAALRLIKRPGVREWYKAKRQRDGKGKGVAKVAVVAVMRKLALALYQVGAKGAKFEAERLFAEQAEQAKRQEAAGR